MRSIFLLAAALFTCTAAYPQTQKPADSLQQTIQQLTEQQQLQYPQSVANFYRLQQGRKVWMGPAAGKHTPEVLQILSCVLPFGLVQEDYHPGAISYDRYQKILAGAATAPDVLKFEVLLTDAVISLLNHLHYGRLNPYFTTGKIEEGTDKNFNAGALLAQALAGENLPAVLLGAQPAVSEYTALQNYLARLAGELPGDCTGNDRPEIRKIAINMERLRWANFTSEAYIHINIPTYALRFKTPDTSYYYKVSIGQPEHPTPELRSAINYFLTGPDWTVPQWLFEKEILPRALADKNYLQDNHLTIYDRQGRIIAVTPLKLKLISLRPGRYLARQAFGLENTHGSVLFKFRNFFDIYMHDAPEQKPFKNGPRALSYGSIRVQHGADLAAKILVQDGGADRVGLLKNNIKAYRNSIFLLRHPLAVKVTYLTCAVENGTLHLQNDLYGLDERLERSFFRIHETLF